jgi:GNAT superfamily N-acetyltransferase
MGGPFALYLAAGSEAKSMVTLKFHLAKEEDFEDLVRLRISVMKESLERIGRFNEDRARDRFRQGFSPQHTRHIVIGAERAGFLVLKTSENEMLLDHLYIALPFQRMGVGSHVLKQVFAEADAAGLPVKVGALKGSESNNFYVRNGFELVSQGEWDLYYSRPSQAIPPQSRPDT